MNPEREPGLLARGGWLKDLDSGIRPYVKILDDNGIETFESCQGGDGHCFPEPTIRFHGVRGEGRQLQADHYQESVQGPRWNEDLPRLRPRSSCGKRCAD